MSTGRGGGFLQPPSVLGTSQTPLAASGWQSRPLRSPLSPSEGKRAASRSLRGMSVTEPAQSRPSQGRGSERPSPQAFRTRDGRGGGTRCGQGEVPLREWRLRSRSGRLRGAGSHSHTSGTSPRAAILGPHGNCVRGRRRSGAVRRCRKWGLSGPNFRPLCPPAHSMVSGPEVSELLK